MQMKMTQNPAPEITIKPTVSQKLQYSYFTAKELSIFSEVCERMNKDEDEYNKRRSTKPSPINLKNA